jgi:hypothetical protein
VHHRFCRLRYGYPELRENEDDSAHYNNLLPSVRSANEDVQLPRCKKMLKDSCYDTFDMISCNAARDFCMRHLDLPPGAPEFPSSHYFLFLISSVVAEINGYDLTKPCIGEYAPRLMAEIVLHLTDDTRGLRRNVVLSTIHVSVLQILF